MVMSSRVSSSVDAASASSYRPSAASYSSLRTFASASWRSDSTLFVVGLDIPALPLIVPVALLLLALEFDEAFVFLLRRGAECLEPVEHRFGTAALVEEVTDAQIECLQDFEKSVQTDFVLSLFHTGKIGLVDADPFGELHLRELSLAAQLTDLAADELDLSWLIHQSLR